MEGIHVFTSAAVNYLPKVRMLCGSLKREHPEFSVHLALADEMPAWLRPEGEPFDSVIALEELGIPNLRSWVFRHPVVALCTAIKPFVLRLLLGRPGCQAVLYFDPDMVVFSRLDDLLDEFRTSSILLTPHQTKPERTLEAIVDNEVCSLRHGVFNLGFVGVKNSADGRAFTDWWGERCFHFCVDDQEEGYFVDQKWVDLAPAFFEGVKILRSSRFNVATWNITTREFAGSLDKGFEVDGEPLGFYHFTGFDSGDHRSMAAKYAGDNASLKRLIGWYDKSISHDESAYKTPWAFAAFQNGEPISASQRVVYRVRKDLQEAFPDPFKVAGDGRDYLSWYRDKAAAEHPDLVNPNGSAAKRSAVRLPTGHKINWSEMWQCGRRAVSDGRYRAGLLSRLAAIRRREGLRGIGRHLPRS